MAGSSPKTKGYHINIQKLPAHYLLYGIMRLWIISLRYTPNKCVNIKKHCDRPNKGNTGISWGNFFYPSCQTLTWCMNNAVSVLKSVTRNFSSSSIVWDQQTDLSRTFSFFLKHTHPHTNTHTHTKTQEMYPYLSIVQAQMISILKSISQILSIFVKGILITSA